MTMSKFVSTEQMERLPRLGVRVTTPNGVFYANKCSTRDQLVLTQDPKEAGVSVFQSSADRVLGYVKAAALPTWTCEIVDLKELRK